LRTKELLSNILDQIRNSNFYNLTIYDLLYRTLFYRHNRKTKRYIEKFSKIDSIKDYNNFSREVISLKKSGTKVGYRFSGCESCFYGHYQMLSEYAGAPSQNRPSFLLIEHGINFREWSFSKRQKQNNALVIVQGKHSGVVSDLDIPIIDIGPYVYYAKNYYSDSEIQSIKRDFGRTVVIYPSHTYELSTVRRQGEEIARKLLAKYEKDFDTILICVYWNDVQDSFFELLSKNPKVRLVSAGMRFDPNFISRTRSILQLSDLVVGTHIGTYIGYALCLGKKVEFFNSDEIIDLHDENHLNDLYYQNVSELQRALETNDSELIQQYYKKFWGGSTKLKSSDEIKALLQAVRDINHESLGFRNRYNSSLNALLRKWKRGENAYDEIKYDLFKQFQIKEK